MTDTATMRKDGWKAGMAAVLARRQRGDGQGAAGAAKVAAPVAERAEPAIEIPWDDPLFGYLQSAAEPVHVRRLDLESSALEEHRAQGIEVIVPLVTHGELIGTLSLGPRLSEQDYSRDDLKLLDSLAAQAAPAVRLAQLVQQQEEEARERERLAHELQVAKLIQQHFLPRELPDLPEWEFGVHYQPAREVGGDFYDFIDFPDGKIGVVVADVTDKGVPAAMVMAAARTMLRATSHRLVSPAEVLERVNAVLADTTPPNMFVTCLYGVLDPATGHFRFANAGHNLPCLRAGGEVRELRATGMPLGLMPGMRYDEQEAKLGVGDALLLYSDGIVEAHDPSDDMFGFPRIQQLMSDPDAGDLVGKVLAELAAFTGPEWHQEDDVTMVTLRRTGGGDDGGEVLTGFLVASREGNEREAMDRVAAAVEHILSPARLERLKTAVAEATMNAIEHGHGFDDALSVHVQVRATGHQIVVSITDHGAGSHEPDASTPDLEAKLAGEQSPRGWGLFLIRSMVDELRVSNSDGGHTVELVMNQGDANGYEAV